MMIVATLMSVARDFGVMMVPLRKALMAHGMKATRACMIGSLYIAKKKVTSATTMMTAVTQKTLSAVEGNAAPVIMVVMTAVTPATDATITAPDTAIADDAATIISATSTDVANGTKK